MSALALTAAQLKALDTYAFLYGRTWKSKLRTWWQGGFARDGALDEDMRLLYCLRNTHGPTWLAGFRFPRMSVCCDAPLLDGTCCNCLRSAAPRVV